MGLDGGGRRRLKLNSLVGEVIESPLEARHCPNCDWVQVPGLSLASCLPWGSDLTSLYLHFLFCEMRILITPKEIVVRIKW